LLPLIAAMTYYSCLLVAAINCCYDLILLPASGFLLPVTYCLLPLLIAYLLF